MDSTFTDTYRGFTLSIPITIDWYIQATALMLRSTKKFVVIRVQRYNEIVEVPNLLEGYLFLGS